MNPPQVPDYYTDDKLTDKEKLRRDWRMIISDKQTEV